MTVEEAAAYHGIAISAQHKAGVQVVNAFTLNYPEEAIGIGVACNQFEIPFTLSFTLETDGNIPGGQSLEEALRECELYFKIHNLKEPVAYGVNCCHPLHFDLAFGEYTKSKISFFKGNSSTLSHAELEKSDSIDNGNPEEWAEQEKNLVDKWDLKIIGGCCGTGAEHIDHLRKKCSPA